jgi:DNA-binding NtrC family response regulator
MDLRLIGTHPAIRTIRRALPALARYDTHVLIIGEPGTGKTLVGRILHSLSPQKHQRLRSLDFALISERDQRLTLFGLEPPEATSDFQSIVELPTTCLLKNIEHAMPHIQGRLVEVLTRKKFRRTTKGPLRRVRGRIIFTGSESDFRQPHGSRLTVPFRDFLRRLPKITIPPLRERTQDIPLIAAHYRKHSLHMSHPALSEDDTLLAPDFINTYPWHRNVSELKACLRAAITYSHTDVLQQKERLEFEMMGMMLEEDGDFSLRRSTELMERYILRRVLAKCNNNQARAARTLGISPSALRSRT